MFWLVKSLAYDVVFTIDSQLVRSGHWNLIFAILALLTFRWWVHLWMKWTMIKQRCTQDKFIYSYVFFMKATTACVYSNEQLHLLGSLCFSPWFNLQFLIFTSESYTKTGICQRKSEYSPMFTSPLANVKCKLFLWKAT